MNIMFPHVFSFQKHWNVRKALSRDRPTHCYFSYAMTFLSYIRTNSKLLFQDEVAMTLIKIKAKHHSWKPEILKIKKNVLIVPQKNPKSLCSLSWKPEANVGICLSSAFQCPTGSLNFRIHHQNKQQAVDNSVIALCQSLLTELLWLHRKYWIFILSGTDYSTVQCW